MKKTIISILEQHQKIVNHFLQLQMDLQEMANTIALIGLQIEDIKQQLQENIKNNNLHDNGDVN